MVLDGIELVHAQGITQHDSWTLSPRVLQMSSERDACFGEHIGRDIERPPFRIPEHPGPAREPEPSQRRPGPRVAPGHPSLIGVGQGTLDVSAR
jgi:hypothetical protein